MSVLSESDLIKIFNTLEIEKPTKSKPYCWWQNGYTFMNNGDNLHILKEDGNYHIITQEEKEKLLSNKK